MNNIEEKISALYDGELSETEAEEILLRIDDDVKLQKKLSRYSLITSAMNTEMNNVQSIYQQISLMIQELLDVS